jgi:hypothetical protein
MVDHGSGVALDFGRLLGFKRVAAAAGNGVTFARALGTACNKAGETPAARATELAKALGATCNKIGETTQLARALGATCNKVGEPPGGA